MFVFHIEESGVQILLVKYDRTMMNYLLYNNLEHKAILTLCRLAHVTSVSNLFRKVIEQNRTKADQDREPAILFPITKAGILRLFYIS